MKRRSSAGLFPEACASTGAPERSIRTEWHLGKSRGAFSPGRRPLSLAPGILKADTRAAGCTDVRGRATSAVRSKYWSPTLRNRAIAGISADDFASPVPDREGSVDGKGQAVILQVDEHRIARRGEAHTAKFGIGQCIGAELIQPALRRDADQRCAIGPVLANVDSHRQEELSASTRLPRRRGHRLVLTRQTRPWLTEPPRFGPDRPGCGRLRRVCRAYLNCLAELPETRRTENGRCRCRVRRLFTELGCVVSGPQLRGLKRAGHAHPRRPA